MIRVVRIRKGVITVGGNVIEVIFVTGSLPGGPARRKKEVWPIIDSIQLDRGGVTTYLNDTLRRAAIDYLDQQTL